MRAKGKEGDKADEKAYCHLLNSTLCAVQRALCCILETYQTENGIVVPLVLRPYMGGKDFIPFAKDKNSAIQVNAKITKGKK